MESNRPTTSVKTLLSMTRRLRRRGGNNTFAGVPSSSSSSSSSSSLSLEKHGLSPSQREFSKSFYCVTPSPLPTASKPAPTRSASSSTASTACSRYSEDSELDVESVSSSLRSPLPQNLRVQGWMYWARQEHSSTCFTKVYAVLRNEFLLLYPNARKSITASSVAATPLVQIAVAQAVRSATSGAFHIQDPHGDELELHLYERQDEETACEWENALEQAVELTESHFVNFDVKVEELSRDSMYRGSLHDLRAPKSTLRQSVKKKLTRLVSFRRSTSSAPSPSSEYDLPEVEV